MVLEEFRRHAGFRLLSLSLTHTELTDDALAWKRAREFVEAIAAEESGAGVLLVLDLRPITLALHWYGIAISRLSDAELVARWVVRTGAAAAGQYVCAIRGSANGVARYALKGLPAGSPATGHHERGIASGSMVAPWEAFLGRRAPLAPPAGPTALQKPEGATEAPRGSTPPSERSVTDEPEERAVTHQDPLRIAPKPVAARRCEHCGKDIAPGRRRDSHSCSDACRQAAYRARWRAAAECVLDGFTAEEIAAKHPTLARLARDAEARGGGQP